MALPAFFSRVTDALRPVADIDATALADKLENTTVRIEHGATDPGSRPAFLLAVNLCARLYPSLSLQADPDLLRETLGVPESISGVSMNGMFCSAIFSYRDQENRAFAVTYESGIDSVPVFDAHLAVYGEKKRVDRTAIPMSSSESRCDVSSDRECM